MSDRIDFKKLKMIMYRSLRWRLQIPDYVPHNPIPPSDELGTFQQGVKCAYRDMLQEIERVEAAENQRRIWSRSRVSEYTYDESFIEEIKT